MKRRSRPILLGAFGLAAALAVTALVETPAHLAFNRTPSVPVGFYWLTDPGSLDRDMLVLAHLPPATERLADRRRYLPAGVPVLKRVAAEAGATVCRDGAEVSIDGQSAARALDRDRLGRALPVWEGCRSLADGQTFLLSGSDPAAFDGRYFGPTSTRLILAEARPLWTW